MAFKHIRSIISEASTDQTLYTVPAGKEFVLLRTRARYLGRFVKFPAQISYEGNGLFSGSGTATFETNVEVSGTTYDCSYALSNGHHIVYPYGGQDQWGLLGWASNGSSTTPAGRYTAPNGDYIDVEDTGHGEAGLFGTVFFKANSSGTFETIDLITRVVAGQTRKTLYEAGSVIKANANVEGAMAEIMGIELKAGTWELVGSNGGGRL